MADLDALRPEVQKALDDLSYFLTGTHNHVDFYTIRAELLQLAAALTTAHETIKRLNRRVQVAEAGVAERVKVSAPGSLGRGLANAAADAFMHERDEARAELAALKARIANSCRADGQRVFDLLGLPIEYDGTLALVKVEE